MKFILGMQIKIKFFYKLILPSWVCVARHTQSTQNKKFGYLFNISRKTWRMKLIFLSAERHQSFLQISFWVCVASHAQSAQSNKFAISLKYFKKNVKDEVDFFACRSTSNTSSSWHYHFRCVWSGMPKLPKITSLLFFLQYLKKEVSDEFDFFASR